jgi:hypothetical protein
MKRLAAVCVLAAVLGVCSQSYGYILVYNIAGQAKAGDIQTSMMSRTMVRGTLVMDIDEEQGFATAATLVLFNRVWGGAGVYTVSDAVGINIYGNSVAAVMDTGWMGGQIIMTGSISTGPRRGINIGLADRKNVANTMDGSIHLNGSMLFNADEALVGAGMMTAILNLQDTRGANRNADTVGMVVEDIISWLQGRGFTEFNTEEPMPS